MNLTEHGIMEIGYLHLEDKSKEEYLKNFVKEFLEVFRNQGHSGGSAPYAINGFKQCTKNKTFIDKDLKELIKPPEELKNDDPDSWMNYDVYELVKKYHELVNTEEFVGYEIEEDFIKNILYRLMDWKPITILQGTPDEWYEEGHIHFDGTPSIQNKRYSAIFAEDNHGKNAYNIDGKIFCRNGYWFTNADSHVPITFPYEVKDRERVYLEDFIPVEDSPKYYIKFKYDDGKEKIIEYSIGYLKSTLNMSIDNPKFYKAEYCILDRYINEERSVEYFPIEEYNDMPIFRVRMNSRFIQEIKLKLEREKEIIEGIYEDKECIKPVIL